jgi:predicted nuclease with TOPRIM domain
MTELEKELDRRAKIIIRQEKRIEELETENRLLGERCNQLLKDKGDLTDRLDELEEENSYMHNTIALQEQQIEKMKRHCNCKHRDSEGYCEVKRTYLMDLSYDGCDKWELED